MGPLFVWSEAVGRTEEEQRAANDAGEMDGQRGRILRKGGLLARFKG
jgi:hypothetical protein